ncbi:dephospho-CoA kinase [Candidatus Enterococcus leclercqii]|uniref:dephospho-CoA kinase n=1 Tax=Candidatus Enterococcus leclercqii TaxID=1857218 RepID=UPI00192A45D7|nr:dephospho-CoA kinase [Enterococcus sp. CU9D]KAF1292134.1 dephospho-CoA kinase [Enterococcus sp. CU9D]
MTFVLGVTGSIATGKTTAVNVFKEFGIPVVDGDQVARKIVAPNEPALAAIVSTFGQEMLTKTGQLNRKRLGDIVFNDPQKRKQLDDLLDGYLREEILRQIRTSAAQAPLVVADIPLLFERGYEQYMDQVAVVYIPQTLQLARLMSRDQLSKKEAQQRIDSQLSIEEKAARGDWVIDNQGEPSQTRQQIQDWLQAHHFIEN